MVPPLIGQAGFEERGRYAINAIFRLNRKRGDSPMKDFIKNNSVTIGFVCLLIVMVVVGIIVSG